MKTCTKCGVEKPRGEFSRRARSKDGLRPACKACDSKGCSVWRAANPDKSKASYTAWRAANPRQVKASYAAWVKANPDKVKARAARWYAANQDKVKARAAAWHAANPEKVKANSAVWAKANPEKAKANSAAWAKANPEKIRVSAAAWARANSDKVCAKVVARKARKLQATPGWADKRGIEMWYAGAKIMTQLTREPYHVDHVVPLKSKLVCGLHAHTNMQILPGAENKAKGNRHWPDMP